MDQFPPTYDFPMDPEDGTVYTDIHMDPNSIPIPPMAPFRAFNDNISDEEEEEEEFEEDPVEEDPEEDHEMEQISDDDVAEADPIDEESTGRAVFDDEPLEHVPSNGNQSDSESDDPNSPMISPPVSPVHTTTPDAEPALAPRSTFTIEYLPRVGGPRVVRTPRKSVRFASTDYASTSRARAPHHSPTPSVTPSPTPGRVAPHTPSSPIGYTPTSEPSSPPFPGNFSDAPIPALALPQPPNDPRVAQLIARAADFGTRISQLEDTVRTSPGPAQFGNLNQRVRDLEEQLNTAEQRAFEVRDRVMFRGGLEDRMQRLEARLLAVEAERDYYRSRTHHLEWMTFGRGRM